MSDDLLVHTLCYRQRGQPGNPVWRLPVSQLGRTHGLRTCFCSRIDEVTSNIALSPGEYIFNRVESMDSVLHHRSRAIAVTIIGATWIVTL
jgi:hypothetical protein